MISPGETRYCFPPARMTAYIPVLHECDSVARDAVRAQPLMSLCLLFFRDAGSPRPGPQVQANQVILSWSARTGQTRVSRDTKANSTTKDTKDHKTDE